MLVYRRVVTNFHGHPSRDFPSLCLVKSSLHRGSDPCNRDSRMHVRHPNQHAWTPRIQPMRHDCWKKWLRKKNVLGKLKKKLKNVVFLIFLRNLTPKICVFLFILSKEAAYGTPEIRRCKYNEIWGLDYTKFQPCGCFLERKLFYYSLPFGVTLWYTFVCMYI